MRVLAERVGARGTAGLAVAGPSGSECWSTAVGVAPGTEPLFLAYSLTKTVLAALVLMLVDDGRFDLSTPVARWHPDVPRAGEITVRHLLSHTSGIPDYGGTPAYHHAVRESPSRPWSAAEFGARTYARGLLFPPGQGWRYSNPGYMLVRELLERETGAPWQRLLDARVAGPLRLAHTRVAGRAADLEPLVPAYSRELGLDGGRHAVSGRYHPGWVAHGVLTSTPRDMAVFYHHLLWGRLLSPRTLREMTTLVAVPDAEFAFGPPGYGLGLMGTTASRHGPLWGHTGGGPGFQASAFHAPRLPGGPRTVCVMCAAEGGDLAERTLAEVLEVLAVR